MYHQLKYETFHDLHELEQESTDNLFFSGFSSDLNNPQNPPSYVSVVEQPQSRQREVDSSSTAQPQSSYVQHVPEHTHRIREIPLTCQPQGTINTTAVTRQPAKRPWRTEVCDCCASWSVCICVTCCPLCYACSLSRRLEENCCLACCPGGLAIMRSNVRQWHNIEGSSMDDVCLTFWCRCCVLCQMGNELNAHDYRKVCCC